MVAYCPLFTRPLVEICKTNIFWANVILLKYLRGIWTSSRKYWFLNLWTNSNILFALFYTNAGVVLFIHFIKLCRVTESGYWEYVTILYQTNSTISSSSICSSLLFTSQSLSRLSQLTKLTLFKHNIVKIKTAKF